MNSIKVSFRLRNRIDICFGLFSLILGFFRAWSLYFLTKEQAELLSVSGNIVVLLLRTLFYMVLFYLLLCFAQKILTGNFIQKYCFCNDSVVVYDKRASIKFYVSACFVLALLWLPHLIVKYPAASCWDSWMMLWEYRNYRITDFHSVYYSILFGYFAKLFEPIGKAEVGLFLFVLIHYFVLVIVFAYSLWILKFRMNFRNTVVGIVCAIYLVCPYIIEYHGVIYKDTLYSAAVALLTFCIIDFALDEDSFCKSKIRIFLLAAAVFNTALSRINGPYLIVAVLIVMLAYSLIRKKRRLPIVIILVSLSIAMAFSDFLERKYNVLKSDNISGFSMLFQQTARYVKYHGDEISPEEAEIIDAVIAYDGLGDRYNPRIADPVKNTYTHNKEALKPYLKLWLKQFLRHPVCYFNSLMEQNYSLFTPEVDDNYSLYRDMDYGIEIGKEIIISETTIFYEPLFNEPPYLAKAKQLAIQEYEHLHNVPIISLLGNVSFYFYCLVFLIVISVRNKIDVVLPLIPSVICLGFVVIGPVLYGHSRYMFPIVYSIFLLWAFLIYLSSRKSETTKPLESDTL